MPDCPNDDHNSGNYIRNNYGDCHQTINMGEQPRPISQHWLDRTCRGLALGVTLLMLTLSVGYLVATWWPLLNGPIPEGALAAHARATLPVFWTLLSCSLGYGYCTTRVFKYA